MTTPTVASTPALLTVKNLSFRYKQQVALREVNFEIDSGEIFGLLGPNGAGKTTTISCVAGLLGQYGGELAFRGSSFRPFESSGDRQHLGVVPQDLALYEDLTARENLEFFGGLVGLRAGDLGQAIQSALILAGLVERADDRVKTYSGGMKRRLNLAIGQLHRPDLLLLDEPTAGVDPQSRNHLFEALERLRQEGRTIVYTTHYMEEAQRLCDRIAIMDRGRVIAVGTASQLADQAGIPGADLERVFLELTGRSLRDG